MPENNKPIKIFVGSSKEALPYAKAIHSALDDHVEITVWEHNVFRPSKGSIESLFNFIDKTIDFAIIVYSPDDKGQVRDKDVQLARDNVILELGLCIGRLGMERTFIFKPKGVKGFALPSDLSGITCVEFNAQRTDNNLEAAVSPGCERILREINLQKSKNSPSKKDQKIKEYQNPEEPEFHKKIVHPNEPSNNHNPLTDEEVKIIKLLGDRGQPFPETHISQILGIGITKTRFLLDNLKEKRLLHDLIFTNSEREFNLSQEGRRFYVENNLENLPLDS